jgi:hypothetical protein
LGPGVSWMGRLLSGRAAGSTPPVSRAGCMSPAPVTAAGSGDRAPSDWPIQLNP